MRNPKRRNPVHSPTVAVPAAILLAVVAAVATCERLAQPEAAEPEAAKVLDGSALRPMMARLTNSGESELEIVRSDVKDDGALAANGGSHLCSNPKDFWKKCPASGRDGWSTWCSCKRVWEDDPWPLECTITEIPDDFFEGGGEGCGGSGDDDDGPVDTILADCPFDDIEGFFVTVDCSPGAVRRGDHVTCTAKTYGAEGDILYNWTFVPDGNARLRGGATYESLPEVTRDSVESAEWGGRGVHGGTVKVTAVDEEGLEGVGVNSFIADERGWTTPVSLKKGDSLTNYIGYTAANRKLGMNSDARPKGSSSAFDIRKGQSAVAVVAEGPNKGYAYVTSHSYRVKRYWHVNERMLVTGPAEIPDTGQSPVNLWTYLKRRGTDPAVLLRGTLAHETYGQYGGKGHQEPTPRSSWGCFTTTCTATTGRARPSCTGSRDTCRGTPCTWTATIRPRPTITRPWAATGSPSRNRKRGREDENRKHAGRRGARGVPCRARAGRTGAQAAGLLGPS